MTFSFRHLIAAASVAVLFAAGGLHAQSLTGTPGLVTIPTAELAPDGTLTAGFNVLNRGMLSYHEGRFHARSPYVSLVYLPFLEVGIRLTRADTPGEEAFGDRTVSARLRLLREGTLRPALLVGVHDFVGLKRHFQATYVVAGKGFRSLPLVDHVSVHAGFGTRLLDALLYDFVGPFGGIAVAPVDGVRVMAEYASEQVNVGIDARLLRGARVIVGVTDFSAVSAGISYSVELGE